MFNVPCMRNETICNNDRCNKKFCKDPNDIRCLACKSCLSIEDYCDIHTNHSKCQACNPVCCMAMTADCLACAMCVTKDKYCRLHPMTVGCNTPLCSTIQSATNTKVCCRANSSVTTAKTCKINTPFRQWSCEESNNECSLTSRSTLHTEHGITEILSYHIKPWFKYI